jgi:hypothetical protein
MDGRRYLPVAIRSDLMRIGFASLGAFLVLAA